MQTMRPGPSGYHRDGAHGSNAYSNGGNVGRHEKGKKLEYAFFSGTSPKFVDAISKMLEKQSFEKQDYLFKEGVDGGRGWNLDPEMTAKVQGLEGQEM